MIISWPLMNDWLDAMIWTDKACVGSLLPAHNGYSMPMKTNIRSLQVSLRCLGHIKYNVHIQSIYSSLIGDLCRTRCQQWQAHILSILTIN